jgi:hypothetical protein
MGPSPENKKLEIRQDSLNHLNTARKWSMFLAIVGFIILGMLIIISLVTGTFLSAFSSGDGISGLSDTLVILVFLALGVGFFFPLYFLLKFSNHMANTVQSLDNLEIYKAVKNLKCYFVWLGIMVIFILALYAIILVASGSSISFLKGL